MKTNSSMLRKLNIVLGMLAILAFGYMAVVLIRLQPKMVVFESLSPAESVLLTGVGVALLIVLLFLISSLWSVVVYGRHAERLTFFSLMLITGGVLSLLFVFSQFALLGDIHKQYLHGLSQPEWGLVFPILTGQFLVAVLLVYLHARGFFNRKQVDPVLVDAHTYLVVQYVGMICGLLGLVLSILGLFFTGGWSLYVHTILASLTLLFPYGLAILYWVITNIQQHKQAWWDEKQSQDLGKSALLTLAGTMLLMVMLFLINITRLDGALSRQWLPVYLFSCVSLFSFGNIYFSSKA